MEKTVLFTQRKENRVVALLDLGGTIVTRVFYRVSVARTPNLCCECSCGCNGSGNATDFWFMGRGDVDSFYHCEACVEHKISV